MMYVDINQIQEKREENGQGPVDIYQIEIETIMNLLKNTFQNVIRYLHI